MSHEGNRCFMGIDINPGTSPTDKHASYAIAILCDGRLVYTSEKVTIERMVRLAWEYKPVVIAVDNPFELARGNSELAKIIQLLPPGSDIVWVNQTDSRIEKLSQTLREEGLELTSKPTSIRTALLLSLLASMGKGKSIIAPSMLTRIKVSKIKSHKRGGMSSNRFKRRARMNVLRTVREIKRLLDENKLDYDLVYKKSGGGLDGALFNVYTSKDKLPKGIKSTALENVRIEIEPVYRIELIQEEPDSKPIIVGIDPGTTTGIAVIDLEGNVAYTDSKKGIDRSWIIETIQKYGKPVIIATDVTPVPDTVKKIASVFNARLYVPKDTVSVPEKRELVHRAQSIIGPAGLDSHERDALAAALLAYREMSAKINQLEAYVKRLGLDLPLSKLKRYVIEGRTISDAVELAIGEMLGPMSSLAVRKQEIVKREETGGSKRLVDKIAKLEWEKRYLEKKIREYENTISDLERRVELLRSGKNRQQVPSITHLKETVSELSKEIRNLNEKYAEKNEEVRKLASIMDKIARGEIILVPVYSTLEQWRVRRDTPLHGVIFVKDLSTYTVESIKFVKDHGLKAILTDTPVEKAGPVKLLEDIMVPVISIENEGLRHGFVNNILYIDTNILQLVDRRRVELSEVLKEREKKELLGIIFEYKENRRRTLEKLQREHSRTLSSSIKVNSE